MEGAEKILCNIDMWGCSWGVGVDIAYYGLVRWGGGVQDVD